MISYNQIWSIVGFDYIDNLAKPEDWDLGNVKVKHFTYNYNDDGLVDSLLITIGDDGQKPSDGVAYAFSYNKKDELIKAEFIGADGAVLETFEGRSNMVDHPILRLYFRKEKVN